MIDSLVIDGRPSSNDIRYLVVIDYQQTWLTFKSFCYLVKLAAARVQGEGWIYKTDIEVGDNQARYIYRMKTEIGCMWYISEEGSNQNNWTAKMKRVEWTIDTETNRNGSYRLLVDPRIISFENHKHMSQFPDASVRALFL